MGLNKTFNKKSTAFEITKKIFFDNPEFQKGL